MRVLFVHQNAPGQFRHLAPHLAADPRNQVVFLGQGPRPESGRIRWRGYDRPRPPAPQTHHYLHRAELAVRRGQSVARACIDLARDGFRPDIVIAHPGWGETMFLREVLPGAKLLSYCEMFYRSEGQDTGYIPETSIDLDGRCRIRAWNADLLTALDVMDHGLAPTEWQRDQHPAPYRDRIDVIHEGIDTTRIRPDPEAAFTVPGGPTFRPGDPLVTFAARDLEPVRGFAMLVRALPELLRRFPAAQVVVCGGDGVSYGRAPPGGGSWRDALARDVALDPARIHFVGKLPRPQYLALLQVSALHLYLSVPFVLSWSCLEALAAGCLVLGSDVAPVREVIEDGRNGLLIDARDPTRLAARIGEALAAGPSLAPLRAQARADAVARFDLRQTLPAQRRLIDRMLS